MAGATRGLRPFACPRAGVPLRCFRFDFTAPDKVAEELLVSIGFPSSPSLGDGLQSFTGDAVVRVDAQRALQVQFGFGGVPFLEENEAEIPVCFGIVRVRADGGLKLHLRLRQPNG